MKSLLFLVATFASYPFVFAADTAAKPKCVQDQEYLGDSEQNIQRKIPACLELAEQYLRGNISMLYRDIPEVAQVLRLNSENKSLLQSYDSQWKRLKDQLTADIQSGEVKQKDAATVTKIQAEILELKIRIDQNNTEFEAAVKAAVPLVALRIVLRMLENERQNERWRQASKMDELLRQEAERLVGPQPQRRGQF